MPAYGLQDSPELLPIRGVQDLTVLDDNHFRSASVRLGATKYSASEKDSSGRLGCVLELRED